MSNAPKGYVFVLFAGGDENDESALVASTRDAGESVEVRRIRGLRMLYPVTPEARANAYGGYTSEVKDVDGKVHKQSGESAAADDRWFHAAETLRGMLRARTKSGDFKYTDEEIRAAAASFEKIGGRTRQGGTFVAKAAADFLKTEAGQKALAKYMAEQAKVNA